MVEGEPDLGVKRMRLRYAGVCRVCASDLPAGTTAVYERSTRSVRCLTHEQTEPAPDAASVEPDEAPAAESRSPVPVDAARPAATSVVGIATLSSSAAHRLRCRRFELLGDPVDVDAPRGDVRR